MKHLDLLLRTLALVIQVAFVAPLLVFLGLGRRRKFYTPRRPA
jgi:hypothetical protein